MRAWLEKGARYTSNGLKNFKNLKYEDVKKVLVIRHAALGDMIQTRPFLYELKKLFPNAKITLSTVSTYQIGAPYDLVDSKHIIDKKNKSFFSFYKEIKKLGQQDIIFDLADTSRSVLLSFLTRAKLKLGFPYRDIPLVYDIKLYRSEFNFEADILLEFLAIFGHKSEYPLNFNMPKFNRIKAHKVVGIFMSSSTPHKNYPVNKYLNVIRSLAIKLPEFEFVLIQGKAEHEKFLDEFKSLQSFQNIKLREFTPLEDLINWISQISLLISNDTGVRYIVIDTHSPTLSVFNLTIPFRVWPKYERCHDFVSNIDGTNPDEARVVAAAVNLLSNFTQYGEGKKRNENNLLK